jgi:hypothetical protein
VSYIQSRSIIYDREAFKAQATGVTPIGQLFVSSTVILSMVARLYTAVCSLSRQKDPSWKEPFGKMSYNVADMIKCHFIVSFDSVI